MQSVVQIVFLINIEMKKLILSLTITIIIVAIIFVSMPYTGKSTDNKITTNESKFVSKIIDGDTVVAEGDHIRLLGFDTDERGEKCYKNATKRMTELVLNKEVILEKDVQNKDQYDRYLRYIFVNNTNIGLIMLKEGLAVARFYDNTKYKAEFIEAEKEARVNKIGCKWS